jgi:glucose/arabinose dehydrogenase
MKRVLVISMFATILVGCSANEQQYSGEEQVNSSEQENEEQEDMNLLIEDGEVIAKNLEIPWSIEKIENTFYLTERVGNIVKIENGDIERQRVELKQELSTASEAGLLGFVLTSDFPESNLAYAYYTYVDTSGQFNRIITLRLEGNVWREENTLVDKIPSGSWHHGGRLKLGPDEKLYATAGDAYESEIAQDPNSMGGKILRINLDGTIPSDNPFPNSYVYSLGHRNPQGLTWSPDGTLYASEHGNDANDEINLIEASQNYGWPLIEGEEEQEGMVSPLFTSGASATWAPSGLDYYDNKLYVAALRGTALIEFNLDTMQQREVVSDIGRIRDVLVEDHFLYFISNNTDGRGTPEENDDKLYRISLIEIEFGREFRGLMDDQLTILDCFSTKIANSSYM